MKCYFEKLIQPLVSNKSLEDLFSKLKDDLSKNFDEKISEQNAKIEKLESTISTHENTIDQLLGNCSDNETCSLREAVCIHGVEVKGKESEDDVMNMLEKRYSSLNDSFDPNNTDRGHCIRFSYADNFSGKKSKFVIV